ncbi:hypothetical protein K663_18991 [Sphingobium sp. MI1205]|nr:hypothetical protein K663_18991 [Sphingobium sp. MI1205]
MAAASMLIRQGRAAPSCDGAFRCLVWIMDALVAGGDCKAFPSLASRSDPVHAYKIYNNAAPPRVLKCCQ